MILPTALVTAVAAVWMLYHFLRRRPSTRARWQFALRFGALVGVTRAVVACAGWYTIEHTGGPLQIPAYAAAILALPEAALLGKRTAGYPVFFMSLSALLVISTMTVVGAIAFAADHARRRRDSGVR